MKSQILSSKVSDKHIFRLYRLAVFVSDARKRAICQCKYIRKKTVARVGRELQIGSRLSLHASGYDPFSECGDVWGIDRRQVRWALLRVPGFELVPELPLLSNSQIAQELAHHLCEVQSYVFAMSPHHQVDG
jgi:hypothetical protein